MFSRPAYFADVAYDPEHGMLYLVRSLPGRIICELALTGQVVWEHNISAYGWIMFVNAICHEGEVSVCGKAHQTGHAVLVQRGGVRDLGPSHGNQPAAMAVLANGPYAFWIASTTALSSAPAHLQSSVIHQGVLPSHLHGTTQGIRFIKDGQIYWGDETLAGTFEGVLLSEWVQAGAWTVGQSHVDGVGVIGPGQYWLALRGPAYFPRVDAFRAEVAVCKIDREQVHLATFSPPYPRYIPPHVKPPVTPPVQPPAEEPNMPATPNRFAVVEQVASQHGHLLETNTFASCAEFVQRVLAAMPHAEGWGHVGKSPGEQGYNVTPEIRVSHDVIWHKPSNKQVDILIYAAANSHPDPMEVPPGPARISWEEIPREHYRPNNLWTAPVPVPGEPPVPPVEPPAEPPASGDLAQVWGELTALRSELAALKQAAVLHNTPVIIRQP